MLNFRKVVFYLVDYFSGGQISKFVKEIHFINENYNESSSVRKTNLNNILEHAVTTTRFYSKFDSLDIKSFPIINKNAIHSNFDLFVSDKYKKSKLHKMHTSGSTGTPFFVYQDKIKRNRNYADLIYYGSKCNFNIGERFVYFRVWGKIRFTSFIGAYAKNMVMADIASHSEENLGKYLEMIKDDKLIKNLLSYASTLDKLSFLCNNKYPNGIDTGLNSIISSSEVLDESVRDRVRKTFRCPVVSRYSNQENGVLAQECIESNNEFHINSASYYIEILDDNNNPVKPGKMGRVVVTDLFNYGMPIIRYDTGDVATLKSESECSNKGRVLERIEGRKSDFIYSVDGELLSPYIITRMMFGYNNDIRQYQLIQQKRNLYLLKLNLSNHSFDNSKLLSNLKQYLGSSALIEVEMVKGIPQLDSGKFKNVICKL